MPSVGDISDLFHPFDAAAEWAKGKSSNEAPATNDPNAPTQDPNPSRGTHLTTAGWIVLGLVLVGGTAYLVSRTIKAVTPEIRFGKARAA